MRSNASLSRTADEVAGASDWSPSSRSRTLLSRSQRSVMTNSGALPITHISGLVRP
jgi:hypothetical protein